MRLTDEEIDLELKSDSWTIKKRMAAELKESRADVATLQDQLRTLRENRFHASSLLDCKEKLVDTSCDLHDCEAKCAKYEKALKVIANYCDGSHDISLASDLAAEALKDTALEKGNG